MLVEKIKERLKNMWSDESSGHDFYHLKRVVNTAKYLQKKEGGNLELIEISAWLHDSFDDKVVENPIVEKENWRGFLLENGLKEVEIDTIFEIIDEVSFRKNKDKIPNTIEAKIVQDADRLDAIGAIGIARTFAYGGNKGRLIYDEFPIPESEEIAVNSTSTVAHFYEKLLRLQEKLNTETAKEIGKERHQVMKKFLDEFYKEWYMH